MTIVSIDPAFGKPMKAALYDNDVLRVWGDLEMMRTCFTVGGEYLWSADVFVTEEPYLGGNAKAFSSRGWAHTYGTICYAVGKIMAWAEYFAEGRCELVRPADWKTAYGVTKNVPAPLLRQIREQLTGISGDEDTQDAILIGRYYIDHGWRFGQDE